MFLEAETARLGHLALAQLDLRVVELLDRAAVQAAYAAAPPIGGQPWKRLRAA